MDFIDVAWETYRTKVKTKSKWSILTRLRARKNGVIVDWKVDSVEVEELGGAEGYM